MSWKFISGKSSNDSYQIYIILYWLIGSIISYLAILKFPVDYNFLNNHVSNIGGITHNPDGHQFWNLAVIVFGILSIPYYAYLYQYFKPNWPRLSKGILGLGMGCAIGFSLVGVFPEDIPIYHQIGAVLFMIGIPILSVIIQYIVYQTPDIVQSSTMITILNLFLWLIFFAAIFVFRLDEWFGLTYAPEPRIFDFPIWEWADFLMVVTWMVGILIPLNKTGKNKYFIRAK
jgi:hypothetical membrane protein